MPKTAIVNLNDIRQAREEAERQKILGGLDESVALTEGMLKQAADMIRQADELEEQARVLRERATVLQAVAESAQDVVRQFIAQHDSEADKTS